MNNLNIENAGDNGKAVDDGNVAVTDAKLTNVAEVDAQLIQYVFDNAKRQREPHLHHTARRMISGEVMKCGNVDLWGIPRP